MDFELKGQRTEKEHEYPEIDLAPELFSPARLILIALVATVGCTHDSPTCRSVTVQGRTYCVYEGAITETGYDCPPEQPNMYRDEAREIVVCSAEDERPPFDELTEALAEIPARDAGSADTSRDLPGRILNDVPVRIVDAGLVDCFPIPVEECEGTPGCAVWSGGRFREEANCYEYRPAYCMSTHLGCNSALTTVRDPEGTCWQFGSGCMMPEGWTDDELRECPSGDTPGCSP